MAQYRHTPGAPPMNLPGGVRVERTQEFFEYEYADKEMEAHHLASGLIQKVEPVVEQVTEAPAEESTVEDDKVELAFRQPRSRRGGR